MLPQLSYLDLVHLNDGQTTLESFNDSVQIAQKLEELQFRRLWIAEHHNMIAIGSAATSLIISHLASHTKTITIGAGGIMLPNHCPLVIAEQFGTLATLYPNRIELGLGRAPGTDQITMRAMKRTPQSSDSFPDDIQELQFYFSPEAHSSPIQAVPGAGLNVPLWVLGSSTFGAQLAAGLGLPYAFASHFAPEALYEAIRQYRKNFKPSAQLQKPYVMLGVNIILADTEEEALFLSTSQKQAFANLVKGQKRKFQKPIPMSEMESSWGPAEKAVAEKMLRYSFIGSPDSIKDNLQQFIANTEADELMVVTSIYDVAKRKRSLELLRTLIPNR